MSELINNDDNIFYKIKLENIDDNNLMYFLDDLLSVTKNLNDDKFGLYNMLTFQPNEYTIIFKKISLSEFKAAFDILIEFLNNYHNPLISNQNISQKLSKILTKEPYSINQITLIIEYLKHYPKIEKDYFSLYSYLTQLKEFYQAKLWPIDNKEIKINDFDKSLMFQSNRYLKRYIIGNRIWRIAFLENKFSFFTYYLTQKIISLIESVDPYYKTVSIDQPIKSLENSTNQEVILYRGIHSQLAKNIMNSELGEMITFKGFQSQTYMYDIAAKFSYFYATFANKRNLYDVTTNIGMVLNLKYPPDFKFLRFNATESEILTYPNSRYRIDRFYFNNFIINCDLTYLDNSMDQIKINLRDFDLQFLTVLKYLNYYIYNINWFKLYMYFLENIEILNRIMSEKKLKMMDVKFKEENYLEEFENYINKFAGLDKDESAAFSSSFYKNGKIYHASNIKMYKPTNKINIEDKLSVDIIKDIDKYLNKKLT